MLGYNKVPEKFNSLNRDINAHFMNEKRLSHKQTDRQTDKITTTIAACKVVMFG